MTSPTPGMSSRQRTPPPAGDGGWRRGRQRGGSAPGGRGRTLAPGIESFVSRYPGTNGDALVQRDRTAWYPAPHYVPPPQTWVNWTAAGPARAELNMRNSTYRSMVGNTRSRGYHDPQNPQRGLHTNPVPGVARTAARFQETQQMVPARINRVSPARYAGQSYSQTTTLQGGGGKR